ncbi:thioredoxin family protein [Pseudobacter ginsenosidimutans]|uniref:Thioredoxin-like protein n=1 Tax=Pseudobacter ginsenosidimutans TaxID=661488 RepID=A0A4Q7MCH6_9BACT|nr:thioredoxin family protein [Pseudobacter ginsenosidimutans]QEC42754.1 thioredoxin family protein [Pseudobacter ginsenosidimutans]RZS65087.1 thioredoxin-like protein [Pseudobacter ginsenosidimutans]
MKLRILSLVLAMTVAGFVANAQSAKPASDILNEAYKTAAREKKNVFVIFHASWCGWCHKMDTAMNDQSVKAFFDKSYVVEHLTVKEAPTKKQDENPGADELLQKYHAADLGIPFWIVLDPKGNLLADSQERPAGASLDSKGQNVGCPATQKEVDFFVEVLKKTSSLKENELKLIAERFRKNDRAAAH